MSHGSCTNASRRSKRIFSRGTLELGITTSLDSKLGEHRERNAEMSYIPAAQGPRTLAVSKPELTRLISSLPFLRSYGFRVQSVAPMECVLRVPFQRVFEASRRNCQWLGVHGCCRCRHVARNQNTAGNGRSLCHGGDEPSFSFRCERAGLSLSRQNSESTQATGLRSR